MQEITLATQPAETSVQPGKSVQFAAQVTGTASTAVTWSVEETDGGTVDANGVYTAPATEGSYHVTTELLAATSTTGSNLLQLPASSAAKKKSTSVVHVTRSANGMAVTVSPSSTTVAAGASVAFGATVTGATNVAVTWSVAEGASCGTVTSTGVYTAPAGGATCHVVATSQADATKSATATVAVTEPAPAIAVAISPTSPTVVAGGTLSFTASVTGTAAGQSTAVTWTVSTACGTIGESSGAYVAPSAAASCLVTATSVADPTKTASTTILVSAPAPAVAVAISPPTATVDACRGAVFTATVTNASNGSVTWGVLETGGGTVTNGIYAAPQAAGTYHVVATSVADPTKSVQATVTVAAERVLSVAVAPGSGAVQANGQLAFAATVTTTCGTFAAQ